MLYIIQDRVDIEEHLHLFSRNKAKLSDYPKNIEWEWSLSTQEFLLFIENRTCVKPKFTFVKRVNYACHIICPDCRNDLLTNVNDIWMIVHCTRCGQVSYGSVNQQLRSAAKKLIFSSSKKIEEPPTKKRKVEEIYNPYPERLARRVFNIYATITHNLFNHGFNYRDFLSKICHLMKFEDVYAEIFIFGGNHNSTLSYLMRIYFEADFLERIDNANIFFYTCYRNALEKFCEPSFGSAWRDIDTTEIVLKGK
jgi:hypothetical protein